MPHRGQTHRFVGTDPEPYVAIEGCAFRLARVLGEQTKLVASLRRCLCSVTAI